MLCVEILDLHCKQFCIVPELVQTSGHGPTPNEVAIEVASAFSLRKGDLRRPSDRMGCMSVRAGVDIHKCDVQRPLRVPSLTNSSEKKPFLNQTSPKFSNYPTPDLSQNFNANNFNWLITNLAPTSSRKQNYTVSSVTGQIENNTPKNALPTTPKTTKSNSIRNTNSVKARRLVKTL